jgi:hypothetical protein
MRSGQPRSRELDAMLRESTGPGTARCELESGARRANPVPPLHDESTVLPQQLVRPRLLRDHSGHLGILGGVNLHAHGLGSFSQDVVPPESLRLECPPCFVEVNATREASSVSHQLTVARSNGTDTFVNAGFDVGPQTQPDTRRLGGPTAGHWARSDPRSATTALTRLLRLSKCPHELSPSSGESGSRALMSIERADSTFGSA